MHPKRQSQNNKSHQEPPHCDLEENRDISLWWLTASLPCIDGKKKQILQNTFYFCIRWLEKKLPQESEIGFVSLNKYDINTLFRIMCVCVYVCQLFVTDIGALFIIQRFKNHFDSLLVILILISVFSVLRLFKYLHI